MYICEVRRNIPHPPEPFSTPSGTPSRKKKKTHLQSQQSWTGHFTVLPQPLHFLSPPQREVPLLESQNLLHEEQLFHTCHDTLKDPATILAADGHVYAHKSESLTNTALCRYCRTMCKCMCLLLFCRLHLINKLYMELLHHILHNVQSLL